MSYTSKPNCMKVSTFLLLLLFFQSSLGQYNFEKLDNFLIQHQKELGSDLVALIYRNDQLVYQKELGDFNAKTQAPIASCSKWLTAALVMQFVDQKKLSLDDPVSKYLPIFATYGKSYITIRNCLSHTTGIQADKPGLISILKRNRYTSLQQEVDDFASKREIEANPGTEFFYSVIGLNIAGRVLEVISKKSFDQLIMQKLFRPLGMKNTSFATEKAVNPSGGAKSTAEDYLQFMQMILNKGVYKGVRILSVESIAEMQKNQIGLATIKYAPPGGQGYTYGLGEWMMETDNQITEVLCPGLFGTWPFIDLQRNYACIFFVKTLLNEQKRDHYNDLKKMIDDQIPINTL